jgi:hypothetical protein
MTPRRFVDLALAPGLSLLPATFDTPAARALILAICLQESDLKHRRQQPHGTARSYAQFEPNGITGVFKHRRSGELANRLCYDLDISPRTAAVHTAIEWSDLLCVGFSRLLLWTLPQRLPFPNEEENGYLQYLDAWRPGKPRYDDWPKNYALAWATVLESPPPEPSNG